MIKQSDVAALCVTYNPAFPDFKKNIENHLKQVDKLYIVDNSDSLHTQETIKLLCKEFNNCKLLTLGENKGIAYALNIGCKNAIKDGYSWILTLDQDSAIPNDFVKTYLNFINSKYKSDYSNIAMLTCNMSTWNNRVGLEVEKVYLCWTSGAFMSLKAYEKTEGFDNDLFIDGVDFDICAKFYLKEYSIIRLNGMYLKHNLGYTKNYKFLGYHLFYITHHNPLRRYYMIRNGLFLSKKYSTIFPALKKTPITILKIIFKILLFENNKIKKLYSIKVGYEDFKMSKYGKCCHKF